MTKHCRLSNKQRHIVLTQRVNRMLSLECSRYRPRAARRPHWMQTRQPPPPAAAGGLSSVVGIVAVSLTDEEEAEEDGGGFLLLTPGGISLC